MQQIQLKNGQTLIIREATKNDAAALIEFVNIISHESDNLSFGPGEFGINREEQEKFLETMSSKKNSVYAIAEIEGAIAGTISFTGGHRPRIAHVGEFGIAVLKKHWGQGIGAELIKYLINWCKEGGIIRKINLRVRKDNYQAISLYKKMGFTEEGLITRAVRIGGIFYDSLLMGMIID